MRVFVSVFDKAGLVPLFKGIKGKVDEIYSTGGTYKHLQENGISVKNSSELTGFTDVLGGRVKTLHPRIFAGILSNRDEKSRADTEKIGAPEFDLVIVNYYPFGEAAKSDDLAKMIENIDIGGVSLVRAAAKNYSNVLVLTDPSDYASFSKELMTSGSISMRTREKLALKALAKTAAYDVDIYNSLHGKLHKSVPEELFLHYRGKRELRYGENPDQKGYLFSDGSDMGIANAEQLNGKELSYNNLVDADSAFETILEFDEPTVVVMKHNTPCGVATSKTLPEAMRKAIDADSESAYGSVIAVNRNIDMKTIDEIGKVFVEVLVAPGYESDALERLQKRKNLRVLRVPLVKDRAFRYKSISNGILAQDALTSKFGEPLLKTGVAASREQISDLMFAWKVVAHCRSNAIVLAKDGKTTGICGGQTSRVEALRIAISKAGEHAKGSALASDAFFPFADSVELSSSSGISSIIQPGGSIRDEEVIKASESAKIPLYFTSKRVFLH